MASVGLFAPKYKLVLRNPENTNSVSIIVDPTDSGEKGDISSLVQSISFESIDGIADATNIELLNPKLEDGTFAWNDRKLIVPGNYIDIYAGYEIPLTFIGRTKINSLEYNFPESEIPTIKIVGYSRETEMMDNGPGITKVSIRRKNKLKTKNKVPKDTRTAKQRVLPTSINKTVKSIASAYGMDLDIDGSRGSDTEVLPPLPKGTWHRVGMSDWDFLVAISNMRNYLLWVDTEAKTGSPDEKWTLHFRNAENIITKTEKQIREGAIKGLPLQKDVKVLKYHQGDDSSLLEFKPNYSIAGTAVNLHISFVNPDTGECLQADIIDGNAEVKSSVKLSDTRHEKGEDLNKKVISKLSDAQSYKIGFGEYSVEVVPGRKFKTLDQLAAWLESWFIRNKEQFIIGEGSMIGDPTIMARQIHTISGLGTLLSGLYYFVRVKHVLSATDGYKISFTARKVLEGLEVGQDPKEPNMVVEQIPFSVPETSNA